MFSQSADDGRPDQPAAPVGMRELPPQPVQPVMPAFPVTPTAAPEQPRDEAGPGPDDSVIAHDDHFEGTFTSHGTVRVEGSVDGRIEAARVRIIEGATVSADVVVDEAIVAGEFTGNLTCRQRLEARASGRISGRVETFKLMLHEGASVEGEMHMLPDPGAARDETIRGTAPVRGGTAPVRGDTAPVRGDTAVAAPTEADLVSPMPRSAATQSEPPEALRVTPRAATPVDSAAIGSSSNGASSARSAPAGGAPRV